MSQTAEQNGPADVRIDKWLWAARFFKTRSLAKDAIDGGHVTYNGQRCKPGRHVEVGARMTIRRGWEELTVDVLALSERRGPAKAAALLYREPEDCREKREQARELRKIMNTAQMPPKRRPNKRDRRRIKEFQNNQIGE